MKEICWVKQKPESSDGCLRNRLVSLPVIDPSFFPIARMKTTTICFPEFFFFILQVKLGKISFMVFHQNLLVKKGFWKFDHTLEETCSSKVWCILSFLFTIQQVIKYYITINKLQNKDTIE